MTNQTEYCPNCETSTDFLRGKPWLPAVCLECGASLDTEPAESVPGAR